MLWLILFVITLFASLYDLHAQRIPNWITLPLLALGRIFHFPGTEETMMASAILVPTLFLISTAETHDSQINSGGYL